MWLHVVASLGGEADEGDGPLQLCAQHVVGALLDGHCVHIDFLHVEKIIIRAWCRAGTSTRTGRAGTESVTSR